ncbi:MAG TPA: TspO protein [Micrococcales bacterium]|uniref:TspO/MBR family protein n=1 Tax=Miniimonas arenae TaxID=676201 RepID=UPI000ECC9DB8|nr:TspO/MBR family protein [Miniimonas arenae]HCX85270.1 TspO protein [Micrococcales bacterium]
MGTIWKTAAAAAACAVVGTIGTKPRSDWYLGLRKPDWQPPSSAFAPVWTTLYGLVAVASARVLDREEDEAQRRRFAVALGINLTLNAGFSWVYFAAQRQRAALGVQLALIASTADLIHRAARVDTPAAAMLTPYLAWDAFATVLNAEVARLNPDQP